FCNAADEETVQMLASAPVGPDCIRGQVTLRSPAPYMLGVVEDLLVDRLFVEDPVNEAVALAELPDVQPAAPHNVFNALAAAALVRAIGVPTDAVRDGLRAFTPPAHRISMVASHAGVNWVDDSKATNTHAADAALRSYEHIVWVAGGQAKGQDFTELVTAHASRLRAVVLLGADRELIADALAAVAPQVRVVEVAHTDPHTALAAVVDLAGSMAGEGDTVLLAPACASYDMFTGYAQRGELFADAVRQWIGMRS
ncbi:MAG TPA: UDP-N-acetylmuramoyl-L-alanine--D-glutamate ligase, partial [Actinobacteria bacterium]|nr:UDP-N-acetylmuramoyl-L-alanine--D-glutamate ligase [Actinomycetota bacterium]